MGEIIPTPTERVEARLDAVVAAVRQAAIDWRDAMDRAGRWDDDKLDRNRYLALRANVLIPSLDRAVMALATAQAFLDDIDRDVAAVTEELAE